MLTTTSFVASCRRCYSAASLAARRFAVRTAFVRSFAMALKPSLFPTFPFFHIPPSNTSDPAKGVKPSSSWASVIKKKKNLMNWHPCGAGDIGNLIKDRPSLSTLPQSVFIHHLQSLPLRRKQKGTGAKLFVVFVFG